MGLEKEIWLADIQANLFKDNQFLTRSTDHGTFVLSGKIVYLPQAGAKATVKKNRTELPATVTRRTDSVISYALDEFTTDPVHIPNIDTVQLSYDKRQSVLMEHQMALNELVAEEMLFNWRPEAAKQFIKTSGQAAPATAPAGTGNRKIVTANDIKAIATAMNKQNISKVNRVGLLTSEMYGQLMDDPMLKNRDFSREADYVNGVVVRLFGIDLMERSSVLLANDAATPVVKAQDAAGAATDNEVSLFWVPTSVARAQGTIDMFERPNDPQYYGDIYSFLVMMGGRKTRANGEGVFGLVQASAA